MFPAKTQILRLRSAQEIQSFFLVFFPQRHKEHKVFLSGLCVFAGNILL